MTNSKEIIKVMRDLLREYLPDPHQRQGKDWIKRESPTHVDKYPQVNFEAVDVTGSPDRLGSSASSDTARIQVQVEHDTAKDLDIDGDGRKTAGDDVLDEYEEFVKGIVLGDLDRPRSESKLQSEAEVNAGEFSTTTPNPQDGSINQYNIDFLMSFTSEPKTDIFEN